MFGDKLQGVLDGDVRIEAVVEDEQFHTGGSCGLRDTVGDGYGKGQFSALDGEAKAQAARTRDQPVLAILRLGKISAVNQSFKDAVDAGLGDVGLLIDVLKREWGVILLKQLDDVERLGQDRNEVQPLDLSLGQISSQRSVVSGKFTVLSSPISVFRNQRPGNSG